MTKLEVRARIQEIGIIPCIHVTTQQDAMYAVTEIADAGIPIVELTMLAPDGPELLAEVAQSHPNVIVGAGELIDEHMARRCLDAGAKFLTSSGLGFSAAKFAEAVVVIPGALTPTEVLRAANIPGCDFVKIFPCAHVGGANYIHALKAPFPNIPLIASGGVNQETAGDFIRAGAIALGIGGALIPQESILLRQTHRIHELARRFASIVKHARTDMPHRRDAVV